MAARLRMLLDYLAGLEALEFRWGTNDCHTFVLRWLDHVAGTDTAADVVGQYDSPAAAREFCRGYGQTLAHVLEAAGCTPEAAGNARAMADHLQPGDILLAPDPGEPWARSHIYLGGGHLVSVWPGRALGRAPLRALGNAVIYAWRPPCPQ